MTIMMRGGDSSTAEFYRPQRKLRRLSAHKDIDFEQAEGLDPQDALGGGGGGGDPRGADGEPRIDRVRGLATAGAALGLYGLYANVGIAAEDWQTLRQQRAAAEPLPGAAWPPPPPPPLGGPERESCTDQLRGTVRNSLISDSDRTKVDKGEAAEQERADGELLAASARQRLADVVQHVMVNQARTVGPQAERPSAPGRAGGGLSRPVAAPKGDLASEASSSAWTIPPKERTELSLSRPGENASDEPGTSRAPPERRGASGFLSGGREPARLEVATPGEGRVALKLSRPPAMRVAVPRAPTMATGAEWLGSLAPDADEPMRSRWTDSDDDMADGEDALSEPEAEGLPEGPSPVSDAGNDDSQSKVHEVILPGGLSARVDVRTVGKNPEFELPKALNSPIGHVRPKCPWTIGNRLGSGSYGTVFEAVDADGMFFAVKEVSLVEQDPKARIAISQLMQEIELLSQFKHEHIVQYLGTERAHGKLYIFLELVTQGSLAGICRRIKLSESQISSYTRQILEGLQYLHARRIVHRDIKCANILVDTRRCKLADFGMAKQISSLDENKSSKGSAYWMAPEVVNGHPKYGLACDIWSLGCSILEMATGLPPFGEIEWVRVMWLVGKGTVPPIPDVLSDVTKDFVERCLVVNPANRPTATELLQHEFVWQGRGLR